MGTVYLICDPSTNMYKIGITKNEVNKRLKNLKTGNSSDIFVLKTYESKHYKSIEKTFHKRYTYLRGEGEWFRLDDELVFKFTDICKEIEDIHIFLIENNEFYK